MSEPAAKVLNGSIVAMICNGLTILESQQEFETEQNVQVVPAKSIWFRTTDAIKLRDFLNEQYPQEVQS